MLSGTASTRTWGTRFDPIRVWEYDRRERRVSGPSVNMCGARPMQQSLSREKRVQARNWWREPSMSSAAGANDHLLKSIVPPYRPLLESELFGHEKGSFTGAFAQKIGRFELAHEGTLFLDEIGEMPLELQPKLLRALQEQEFERLGGSRTIHVNVRIIAATNRNLRQMVDEGTFRGAILSPAGFSYKGPAAAGAAERRSATDPLLHAEIRNEAEPPHRGDPAAALEALTSTTGPGNIRELQHLVERSVILSPGRVLQISVPDAIPDSGSLRWTCAVSKDEIPERERILEAIRLSDGMIGGDDGAAARLGLRRTTLQSRMKKLGIARHFG